MTIVTTGMARRGLGACLAVLVLTSCGSGGGDHDSSNGGHKSNVRTSSTTADGTTSTSTATTAPRGARTSTKTTSDSTSNTRTTRVGSTNTTAVSRPPSDPSALVLRASEYPQGQLNEQGTAKLYDEVDETCVPLLHAAGVTASGAYLRSFNLMPPARPIPGWMYSLAVVTASDARAHALLRDGWSCLLAFGGAGDLRDSPASAPPTGLGSEAVARTRKSQDDEEVGIVWRRGAAIGLLIVERPTSQAMPDVAHLTALMDGRMRG